MTDDELLRRAQAFREANQDRETDEERIARLYREAGMGAGVLQADGTLGPHQPNPTETRVAAALAAGVDPARITSGGRVIRHRGPGGVDQ